MILLFNMYIFSIDEILEQVITKPENLKPQSNLVTQLKTKLDKAVRYVKYCLMMLELACASRVRRQELIYRCHFDYIYIGILNYLFSQHDALISISKTVQDSTQNIAWKNLLSHIEWSVVQLSAFLPTLVISVDSQNNNFNLLVRMRRQKFSTPHNSLCYKLIMDTLLTDGAHVCELDTLTVHKVRSFAHKRLK
jgi:hypothetical protein